tara:strand:- start:1991 stop:2368 length:378 start_codon:yes stop_codon:yes gene_type:complete
MEITDIENGIISNEDCIFCQDNTNSKLINYEHTCGKFKIHQECLDKWFIKNSTSCIICRENIINNSPTNNHQIETSIYSPINENNNYLDNTNLSQEINQQNNRRSIHACFIIILFVFIILLFILL